MFLLLLFFRERLLGPGFRLGYEGKLVFLFFLSLGTSLTFLLLLFFRGRLPGLDFCLGYEGKVVWRIFFDFLCFWNAINVPFASFFRGRLLGPGFQFGI